MLGGKWETGAATIVEVKSGTGTNYGTPGFPHEVRKLDFAVNVHSTGLTSGFRGTTGWMDSRGVEHLRPGDIVAVKFDPKTQNIRLERSRNFSKPVPTLGHEVVADIPAPSSAETPPAADSTPTENAVVESLSLAEILATGAPARVIVVEAEVLSPPLNDKAGHPFYRFLLTVTQDGVDPYRNEEAQGVPPYALPLIYPGANLAAKVVAGEHVAIDWDATRQQAAGGGR